MKIVVAICNCSAEAVNNLKMSWIAVAEVIQRCVKRQRAILKSSVRSALWWMLFSFLLSCYQGSVPKLKCYIAVDDFEVTRQWGVWLQQTARIPFLDNTASANLAYEKRKVEQSAMTPILFERKKNKKRKKKKKPMDAELHNNRQNEGNNHAQGQQRPSFTYKRDNSHIRFWSWLRGQQFLYPVITR